MKKMIYLFAFPLLVANQAVACKLPNQEKLTIGCTHKCGFTYKLRLKMVAKNLGFRLNIVDLSTMGEQGMDKVDGVLIPGGADINPEYYLSSVTPELQETIRSNIDLVKFSEEGRVRDPFEYKLVQKYSSEQKYASLPMLGICRGMQMMGVAQGMPLYLDIKEELGIRNRRYLFDSVQLANIDSLMSQLYAYSGFRGYKLHHQGIRVPYVKAHSEQYPNAKLSAFSHKNKIAEAIEYNHRPALGVQYHPEMSFNQTTKPVFKWFLNKSCEHKNSSKETL